MKTRSRKLQSELRTITKGPRTVAEFIARVHTISVSLASIGDPISHRDLIETVLEALLEEFNAIVASVNSKSEVISLDELESQLLTQESRNEKFKKVAIIEPVAVNLTETSAPEPNSQGFSSEAHGNNQFPNPNPNFGGRGQFRGRGGHYGGRFRGRGSRFGPNSGGRSSVQCQICSKTGHDASYCHFCFSTPQPDYYSPYGMQGAYGYGGNSSYGAPSNVWMQPMPRAHLPGQFRLPFQAGSQKGYPTQAFLTGSEAHNSYNNVWYLDLGATHHVTPNASNLMDFMSLSGSDQVHIGNGQGLAITSVGSLQFPSPLHPKTTLKLNILLLVPAITKNLVSVSQFAKDNDVFFEFHANHCFVKSQDSSKVLLRGVLGHDGLYQFEDTKSFKVPAPVCQNSRVNNKVSAQYTSSTFTPLKVNNSLSSSTFHCNNVEHLPNGSTSSSVKSFPSLYIIWHSRLGHPHHEMLQSIIKLCNVKISNKNASDFCTACCLGKVHRLPSYASKMTYTKPLELIFCDLWGPAPVELSCGYIYFLTCVDAYSRYTWIYPLKLKSHTLHTFQNFKTMIELQLNHKIISVQTDGGGEFLPFTKYLNDLGITHKFTCPHTHHQNGSVERKHKHIVETGLTLLSHAQMPLQFWDHAFLTTTYLINRLPTPVLANKSPFFLLNFQFLDYKFLKSFGCACFPFLRPYNSHKLDFHSKECVFLGYSSHHKGYKCLDASGRIFVSKDVVFNEAKFPFHELFPSQTGCHVKPDGPTLSTFLPTPISTVSSNSHSSSSVGSDMSAHHPASIESEPASPIAHTPVTSSATSHHPDFSSTPMNVLNPTPITVLSPSPSQNSPSESSATTIESHPASHVSTPPVPHIIHPNNTHSMRTRGKLGIVQPRLHPTLLLTHVEPTSYKTALKDAKWRLAMKDEFNALMNNQTWTLVSLPANRHAIGCKWVFRVKEPWWYCK